MRTKFNSDGEDLTARARIKVRKNSLFPDPVVPTTTACGPSLSKSMAIVPSDDAPITAIIERASQSLQRRLMAVAVT